MRIKKVGVAYNGGSHPHIFFLLRLDLVTVTVSRGLSLGTVPYFVPGTVTGK